MSNHLAIATVTAALQQALQTAVGNAVPNAKVGFSRPDTPGAGKQNPLVNVFLYQVTPNAAYRNADLPARRPDGTMVERPQAALDLHYLFTFHGDDDQLVPQRLLGVVASVLHAQPILSRQDIVKGEAFMGFQPGSGLENQVERVRFTPTAFTLEEFSKLWSVFFQVEYMLSAAYQASVVLIQSADVPQEALPVQTRNLYTTQFRWPQVDRVISQAGPDVPILSGDTVVIQGRQLRADITLVAVEGQELTPASVRDNEIVLKLPTNLHAGVKSLQVVQKMLMGNPPAAHRGFESNAAAFVLHPTINGAVPTAVPGDGVNVNLTLDPNIGIGQRAIMVLNSTSGSGASFVSPPVVSAADSSQAILNITGVPAGPYFVRVQVNGAESLLTTGPNNQFTGPTVNMP